MNAKIILFLAIICSILTITDKTIQANEHQLDKHIVEEFGLEFALNYLKASRVHDEMWELIPRSPEGELMHPTYYGGHFICKKGKFNFNIVGSLMAEAKNGVFAELFTRDVVQIRAVDFSHQELTAMLDVIYRFVSDNPDSELKIVTWGIDSPRNKVVVQMQEYSSEKKALFERDVVGSPMVVLEEGQPVKTLVPRGFEQSEQEMAVVSDNIKHFQAGMRIFIGTSGFSAGYPAERGRDAGFVTALHGLPLDEELVRLGQPNGPIIGVVTAPIRNEGSVDGAFISLQQSIIDKTIDNKTLIHSDMRPAQGMILTSVSTPPDGVTRVQRNIVVSNTHFNADFGGGLVLTNLIQTTGDALYGESGGLVFRPVGNDAQVKGVIVGSDSDSVKGEHMFFSWAGDINSKINVTQP